MLARGEGRATALKEEEGEEAVFWRPLALKRARNRTAGERERKPPPLLPLSVMVLLLARWVRPWRERRWVLLLEGEAAAV